MRLLQLFFLSIIPSLIAVQQSLIPMGNVQWFLKAQYGMVKFISNESKVPNDSEANAFDLPEATTSSLRLYLSAIFCKKHEFRLLYAPLEYEKIIKLDEDITFNGATFSSNLNTSAGYRFNSYRLSYIYHLNTEKRYQYRLGLAGKIRDASIYLKSDSNYSKYSNTGFVPLLHIGVKRRWKDKLCWDAELEGSWAPQGYALDFRTSVDYQLFNGWFLGIGTGFLQGGADNDKIKTFSTIFSSFLNFYKHF